MRRLRKTSGEPSPPRVKKRMSQVDMAYDILVKARKPLHISELLDRIERSFQVAVDRESLVSSITKKVMRGDRFVREEKNTFAAKERRP